MGLRVQTATPRFLRRGRRRTPSPLHPPPFHSPQGGALHPCLAGRLSLLLGGVNSVRWGYHCLCVVMSDNLVTFHGQGHFLGGGSGIDEYVILFTSWFRGEVFGFHGLQGISINGVSERGRSGGGAIDMKTMKINLHGEKRLSWAWFCHKVETGIYRVVLSFRVSPLNNPITC